MPNTDFDTGKPTRRGEYGLADDTYDELLDKLAGRKFEDVPDALRANMIGYYEVPDRTPPRTRKERKRTERTRRETAALRGASTTSPSR